MDIHPNKSYVDVLADAAGARTASQKWFATDIELLGISEEQGIVIVCDYNISANSDIDYTIDGTNWIRFEPTRSADYKKIRLYHNSKFNIRATDAVTIHHCKIAGG